MSSEAVAYSAPPILEAVVQILFAETLSVAVFQKVCKKLRRHYANETPSQDVNVNVDFQLRSASFTDQPQARLSSADEADILVVRPNALTWSRLAPYQGWDAFCERVDSDLKIAHGVSGARKPSRLGVRYINRIDVPIVNGLARFEDYLAINIDIPAEIDAIRTYAWRFERNYLDKNCLVIVQSASVEPEIPDTGAFVLDIDVVTTDELPMKNINILERLNLMRQLKNQIFEMSIKDEARARFKS